MGFDRPFRDGQAEPDAAGISRSRMVYAIKAIEYPLEMLFGDAASTVADFHGRPCAVRHGHAGPVQQQVQGPARHVRRGRRLLVFELETQVFGLERYGPHHVENLVPDTMKTRGMRRAILLSRGR